VLLAPPAGIEPAACGLGSLLPRSLAFNSAIWRIFEPQISTKLPTGDIKRQQVNVHQSVHSGTDIHASLTSPKPLSIPKEILDESDLVISLDSVPESSTESSNTSAAMAVTWFKIFVRQWTSTPDSHSASPMTSSERWTYWHAVVGAPGHKLCGNLLTSISHTASSPTSLNPCLEVGEEISGEIQTPC
jgi:hypothetical protein